MKLKYDFVINSVADKMIAVPIGKDTEDFNGFIKLNNVGASIFTMLKEDCTEEQIVSALQNEYEDATNEEIRETVKEFIARLEKEDLLA
ncbi:MAG: PqqD family protein [Clostridia bacterium]|nr:PqqD family protein [Clostridia bacterium]